MTDVSQANFYIVHLYSDLTKTMNAVLLLDTPGHGIARGGGFVAERPG